MKPATPAFNLDPKFRAQLSAALSLAEQAASRIAAMSNIPNSTRQELTFHDQRLADAFGGIGPDSGTPAMVERRPFTPPPIGSPALTLVA